jgi:hypothetical protein
VDAEALARIIGAPSRIASRRTAEDLNFPGFGPISGGDMIVGDDVWNHPCTFCDKPGYTVTGGNIVCEDHNRSEMRARMLATRKTAIDLNAEMDFDHVIEVKSDGSVMDAQRVYAPSLYDDELDDPSWTLIDGYSGQSGYSGPLMHQSEYIGGGLENEILTNPGYYVALANYRSDDKDGDGPTEWAVAYKPAPTTASRRQASKVASFQTDEYRRVHASLSPENQAILDGLDPVRAAEVVARLVQK